MKALSVLILIVILCACINKKAAIELNSEVTIDVTEINKYLNNLFEFHPDRQVKIYNVLSPSSGKPAIALYVYRKRGDQPIQFIYETPNKYEKAVYKWANDSTVSFRLFNTTNRYSAHFTFSTHYSGSTLQIDSLNNIPIENINGK